MLLPILGRPVRRGARAGRAAARASRAAPSSSATSTTVFPLAPRQYADVLGTGLEQLERAARRARTRLRRAAVASSPRSSTCRRAPRPSAAKVRGAQPREGGHQAAAGARWSSEPAGGRRASTRNVARLQRHARATRAASTGSTGCSSAAATGSRTGGWRARRSTTAASSTSTAWPPSAWRTPTSSRRRTRSSSSWLRRGQGARACASTTPTGCSTRPPTSSDLQERYFLEQARERSPASAADDASWPAVSDALREPLARGGRRAIRTRRSAARSTWWWRRSRAAASASPTTGRCTAPPATASPTLITGLFVDRDGEQRAHRDSTSASSATRCDFERAGLREEEADHGGVAWPARSTCSRASSTASREMNRRTPRLHPQLAPAGAGRSSSRSSRSTGPTSTAGAGARRARRRTTSSGPSPGRKAARPDHQRLASSTSCEDILLRALPGAPRRAPSAQVMLRFAMKLQQLTGPVMAKGLEDTVFYVYNRLVSLNEVGGEPERFGTQRRDVPPAQPGARARLARGAARQLAPTTPSAARTCARGSTCSPRCPRSGARALRALGASSTRATRPSSPASAAPDRATTSTSSTRRCSAPGRWARRLSGEELADLPARGCASTCSRRSGRRRSTPAGPTRTRTTTRPWRRFVERVARPGRAPRVPRQAARSSSERIERPGQLNALGAAAAEAGLARASPDIYQGCELWDLSLVDPDNRRPVDFAAPRRDAAPSSCDQRAAADRSSAVPATAGRTWTTGASSCSLTAMVLRLRQAPAGAVPRAAATSRWSVRRHRGGAARWPSPGGCEDAAVVGRCAALVTRGARARAGSVRSTVRTAHASARPTSPGRRFRNVVHRSATCSRSERGRWPLGPLFADFPVALLEAVRMTVPSARSGPGKPQPLGATCDGEGVNFAVFSERAERIEVCLFDSASPTARLRALHAAGADRPRLARLRAGAEAGDALRLARPRAVRAGARACASTRTSSWSTRTRARSAARWTSTRPVYGYRRGEPAEPDLVLRRPRTAPPGMPEARGADGRLRLGGRWSARASPGTSSILYELHVKGFTMRHPGVPETCAAPTRGFAHPAVIEHLQKLGVTAVELLPVHAGGGRGVPRATRASPTTGATTRWATSRPTRASPAPGPCSAVHEFKGMVKALHARRHRGDPRRRLQPHLRGQSPRARRSSSRGSTTRPTTG